jgi:O-antigen/teichoic acid export membrane protein
VLFRSLILANIFLGIIYNLSIWYKVKEKNNLGALISMIGAVITITLLVIFIPKYGFLAAAYITLLSYFVMMVLSYFVGQKHFPVPYNVANLLVLFGVALLLYGLDLSYLKEVTAINIGLKLIIFVGFTAFGFAIINRVKKLNLPLND